MKDGIWPSEYMQNPHSDKPIEQIWDDIDAYSFESMYSKTPKKIEFVVPFPPLDFDGKFIKGVFYSQAVDLIVEKYPEIKKIFF